MRRIRANSPLRNWDIYWQKKWEEERKEKENEKKELTNYFNYGIIKSR